MTDTERKEAVEARKEVFRLAWFGRLLGGQLSLGDTFWIGNFGVTLVFVPAAFAVLFLMRIFGSHDQTQFMGMIAITVVLALYWAFLTRAVFLTALRTPQVGGWRWFGLAYTVVQFAMIVLFSLALLEKKGWL